VRWCTTVQTPHREVAVEASFSVVGIDHGMLWRQGVTLKHAQRGADDGLCRGRVCLRVWVVRSSCVMLLLSSLMLPVEVAGCHKCILQGGGLSTNCAGDVGTVRPRGKHLCD
jgi:hypothetical protein